MNLLSLDIGNTTMHFVVYDQTSSIVYNKRELTHQEDEFGSYFMECLKKIEYEINVIVLSCVVPSIHESVRVILKHYYSSVLLDVNMQTIGKMESRLEGNEAIGADLLACAYGAYQLVGEAVIIVDMGSANKIIVVGDDFVYEGGIIFPGIGLGLRTFEETLKHLPKINLEYPEFVLGRDTDTALRSGFMYGIKFQIEAMISEIEEELGIKAKRILTGGYAQYFEKNMPLFDYYPNLIHHGHYYLYMNSIYKQTL
ncbi:type III pantothenate kinase [Erysipelothrix urinaevulpis]|uniref:type III pantothenate kinase n=1 Tax=Erysipelothrix urinaevulpis TaxID=2683717 RepID=UPI00135808E6|nr:type III pantothenate kinase [Erysipelothrix urinaevulpis]